MRLNIGLSLFMKKKQIDPNEENLSDLNIVVTHSFRRTINVDEIPLVDVVHAIRKDHDEGIYIWPINNFMCEFRVLVKIDLFC